MPNITGDVAARGGSGIVDYNADASGAFKRIGSNLGYLVDSSSLEGYKLGFDASLSNSIYGNSDTVQPATCKTYFIIKY